MPLTAARDSVTLAAQWPGFVRADVPTHAGGQPDLSAPTPRLANGKPDLSGVWESRIPPSGRLGGPMIPILGEAPPLATFVDVGRNMKGGLPYTPWAAELRKQRMATVLQGQPRRQLPAARLHAAPHPLAAAQDRPHQGRLVILYEANAGSDRSCPTDGRCRPSTQPVLGRLLRGPLGRRHAGGRVDGLPRRRLAGRGRKPLRHHDQVTERFRRVNYGRLEIDVTVEDPKAYTQPFTVRVN